MPAILVNDCLPGYLYSEIVDTQAEYVREGDFSPSMLVRPVQALVLMERHDVEVPASTRLWALYGTALHNQLGKYDRLNKLKEESFTMRLPGGKVLSGRPDMYDGDHKAVRDYKLTSVWAYIYGSRSEWEWQTNIYAYLIRHLGWDVERLFVDLFFRDWNKRVASTSAGYPPPMASLEIETKDDEALEKFIDHRIGLIEDNRARTDDCLTPCTPSETWAKSTVYKVKKKGNKVAMRGGVCDSMEQAHSFIAAKGLRMSQVEIVTVKGERTRCEMFCEVSSICNQRRIEIEMSS